MNHQIQCTIFFFSEQAARVRDGRYITAADMENMETGSESFNGRPRSGTELSRILSAHFRPSSSTATNKDERLLVVGRRTEMALNITRTM